jgi:hypothetical protein
VGEITSISQRLKIPPYLMGGGEGEGTQGFSFFMVFLKRGTRAYGPPDEKVFQDIDSFRI